MNNKPLILTMVLFVAIVSIKAQEATTTSGREACGSGGTASYTVGQVFYVTQKGTDGNTVAQGVQQPYEISVETGIPEAKDINLSISAYPNPTTYYLTVKVENYKTDNLQYMIFDINGKLLQKVKATGQETKIKTENLINGSYIVKVLDNSKEIKVFKIIKTD